MPDSPSYAVRKGRGTSPPHPAAGPADPTSADGSAAAVAPSPQAARHRGRATARTSEGTAKEGARHGRSSSRRTGTGGTERQRLLCLAVLPALVVTVLAAVALVFVLRDQQGAGGLGGGVWWVLAGAVLLCCATVSGAVVFASAEARRTVERYTSLRRLTARHQAELQALLQRLERGEQPSRPGHGRLPEAASDDAYALLTREVTTAARLAEAAVLESAVLARSNASGSEEKVEVFVNLSRRLQSLVHREIELLDELENEVEDPDLLKGLFHVDHLATRIRRHAENLAVLGGAVSRRQWTRPVTMTEVLRSAIAEVEQYPRVKLVPPIEGNLRGHAVADVIHLLAELIENASVFSAPQTQVLLRAQHVTAGLAVEVEDRGLGMTASEQNRMNTLLSDPEHINVADLLQDGRIGLFVVSQLARRHGIVVQLQSNIYGGVQAVLILPRVLLGQEPAEDLTGGVDAGRDAAERVGAASRTAPQDAPPAASGARGGDEANTAIERDGSLPPEALPAPRPRPGGQTPVPARQYPDTTALVSPSAPSSWPVGSGGAPAGNAPLADGPLAPARAATQPGPRPVPEGAPASATGAVAVEPTSMPLYAGTEGERPRLPRRRRQQHLAPELRTPPPASATPPEGYQAHDPGLMAAFRRGTSLADSGHGTDSGAEPGGTTSGAGWADSAYGVGERGENT